MKIVTYDDLDPFDVLDLNLLAFNFALTPELVATLRRVDERPFPFFALYAVDQGRVLGQVGVFRVPLMTVDGPLEAGSIWAMCTHPAFSRQGVGSLLLHEAHRRMRAANLPYAVLGTSRHWVAHPFYRKHGYVDLAHFASALAPAGLLPEGAGQQLHVSQATLADLPQANQLFDQIAADKTGFSRRQDHFLEMMIEVGDILSMEQLRLIRLGQELVGYGAVHQSKAVLAVNNFWLREDIALLDAATALLRAAGSSYLRLVTANHSPYLTELREVGFRVTEATLDVTMIKDLGGDTSREQVYRLFDVAAGRFMMSGFDVT